MQLGRNLPGCLAHRRIQLPPPPSFSSLQPSLPAPSHLNPPVHHQQCTTSTSARTVRRKGNCRHRRPPLCAVEAPDYQQQQSSSQQDETERLTAYSTSSLVPTHFVWHGEASNAEVVGALSSVRACLYCSEARACLEACACAYLSDS
jgi:hypothetical protein